MITSASAKSCRSFMYLSDISRDTWRTGNGREKGRGQCTGTNAKCARSRGIHHPATARIGSGGATGSRGSSTLQCGEALTWLSRMGRKILPESVTGLALKARAPRAAALERMALAGVESTLESMARICGRRGSFCRRFFLPRLDPFFFSLTRLCRFSVSYTCTCKRHTFFSQHPQFSN